MEKLDRADVCLRADVAFDESDSSYVFQSFSQEIRVCPTDRDMSSTSSQGKFLLENLGGHFRLAALHYLIQARETASVGELISPKSIPGGDIFSRGTHRLPLDRITERYSGDLPAFHTRGSELGAEQMDYGDASIRLTPFPRVPSVLILWQEDEEFPARADLLLYSSCRLHLPVDLIWATTMMSVLMMVPNSL